MRQLTEFEVNELKELTTRCVGVSREFRRLVDGSVAMCDDEEALQIRNDLNSVAVGLIIYKDKKVEAVSVPKI